MENQRKFSQFNKSFGFGNILILKHFEDPPWFKKKDKSYGLFSFNFSFQRLKVLLKNFEQKKKVQRKRFLFFFKELGEGLKKTLIGFLIWKNLIKNKVVLTVYSRFRLMDLNLLKKKIFALKILFFLKKILTS